MAKYGVQYNLRTAYCKLKSMRKLLLKYKQYFNMFTINFLNVGVYLKKLKKIN